MRINKISGIFVLVAMFVIGLTSCGGYSEKAGEKMIEKYEDGEITKDDIATCIDWVEDAQNESLESMEDVLEKSGNRRQFDSKMEDAQDIFDKKWDGMEEVVEMLDKAAIDKDNTMGSSDKKRWQKVQDKFHDKVMKFYEKVNKKFND